MASSKLIVSWSLSNPDPPRQPSPSRPNFRCDQSLGFGSMNFDDIFRDICSDSQSFAVESGGGAGHGMRYETAEEVWRNILSGRGGIERPMTLEDFLTKAGSVDEEDVRVSAAVVMLAQSTGGFGTEAAVMIPAAGVPAVQFSPAVCVHDAMTPGVPAVDFANGMVAVSGGGSGREKRKAVVEQVAMYKATQQKQKRMIKNRASAARSRERKQAYTLGLEAVVTELAEANARLLKEVVQLNKERHEQLIKNISPVVEKPRPQRIVKKVHSMEW